MKFDVHLLSFATGSLKPLTLVWSNGLPKAAAAILVGFSKLLNFSLLGCGAQLGGDQIQHQSKCQETAKKAKFIEYGTWDFVVFPVSRHFVYSRDFACLVSGHFLY